MSHAGCFPVQTTEIHHPDVTHPSGTVAKSLSSQADFQRERHDSLAGHDYESVAATTTERYRSVSVVAIKGAGRRCSDDRLVGVVGRPPPHDAIHPNVNTERLRASPGQKNRIQRFFGDSTGQRNSGAEQRIRRTQTDCASRPNWASRFEPST